MTADEFNVHYAMLRLTDLRISRDLRVNTTTVWRWRKGHQNECNFNQRCATSGERS